MVLLESEWMLTWIVIFITVSYCREHQLSIYLLSIPDCTHNSRNKLLRVLPLSKHIHGMRHHNRHLVGVFIGDSKLFSCCLQNLSLRPGAKIMVYPHLSSSIRITRVVPVIFCIDDACRSRSKNLIGREVHKPV